MVAGAFSVGTTPTTGSLSVNQFYATPPATPGNVGVSLSGGGSRALTAGMGQLRALNKLAANGQSLLAQVKALSTVSGGSWIGVPFIYLPPGSPSDAAYLGPWIEDQSTLTPAILAQWRKCRRADQLATLRPEAPRRSSPAAACGPARPAGHAVADHHRAEHPRRLRAVRTDDPPHAHRHVFLRRGGGGDPGHEPKPEPGGCR